MDMGMPGPANPAKGWGSQAEPWAGSLVGQGALCVYRGANVSICTLWGKSWLSRTNKYMESGKPDIRTGCFSFSLNIVLGQVIGPDTC